jgi:hypothetical protein
VPGDDEEDRAVLFDEGTLSDVQLYSCAARVLGANYVVGLLEASMLGLFTSDNWQSILNVLIGWEQYCAHAQKKRALSFAEPPSSTGPAGTSPITGLRSPTSSPSAKDST